MTEQAGITVYQRTGKTDPKNPRRYKQLTSTIEKLTPLTVQLDNGVLLRRSGVSFRSAAYEARIRKKDKTNTPGTSRSEGSKNAGDTEKTKAAT